MVKSLQFEAEKNNLMVR